MNISVKEIRRIMNALDYLIPAHPVIDDSVELPLKEAVLLMAPKLVRMQRKGCTMPELLDFLTAQGLPVKAAALTRYLNEYLAAQKKPDDATAEETAAEKSSSAKPKKKAEKRTETPAEDEAETAEKPAPESQPVSRHFADETSQRNGAEEAEASRYPSRSSFAA